MESESAEEISKLDIMGFWFNLGTSILGFALDRKLLMMMIHQIKND